MRTEGQAGQFVDDIGGAQADGDDAFDQLEDVLFVIAVAVGIVGLMPLRLSVLTRY